MGEIFASNSPDFFPTGKPNPIRVEQPDFKVDIPLQLVGEALASFYQHELNFTLFSFWDGGYFYCDQMLENDDYHVERFQHAPSLGESVGDLGEVFARESQKYEQWWRDFLSRHKIERTRRRKPRGGR